MQGSEPAFPTPLTSTVDANGNMHIVDAVDRCNPGMSTRLVVASKIMASYLIDPTGGSLIDPDYRDPKGVRLADKIAAYSVNFADALIAACKENPNG